MKGPLAIRASIQLAVLFAAGLLAGLWTFLAPWIVGFPAVRPGQWTSSTWATVWVAAIVIGASSVGLVIALALTASAVPRQRPASSLDQDGA